MSTPPRCVLLPWDSNFFGLKIGRVQDVCRDVETLRSAIQWGCEHELDCVYALLDGAAPLLARSATELGFDLRDLRVTLKVEVDAVVNEPTTVREAVVQDLPALRAIASQSHRASRFYADPGFPLALCDALYADWIERSLYHQLADAVLVPADGAIPLGYVTCSVDPQGLGHIGLFAVAREARGRGYGEKLLDGALRWFQGRGVVDVSVVTQGGNAGALTVYHRRGFVAEKIELWHHAWPKLRR